MSHKKDISRPISQEYAAVILAAGYSSRMNAFKPLLPVGGLTAVERSISEIKAAGIDNIVVVTGYNREKLQDVLVSADVEEAYNSDYDSGMFSSIKAGLDAARNIFGEVKGVLLMPVDCPLISSTVISSVLEGEASEDTFRVPVFEGKKGHPLMIPASYIDEICAYEGPGGLKAITDQYQDKMIRIPVGEEGCLLDMDTPEGYEEIKNFLSCGCRREPLEELAAGRRIWLVRHGQTKQHDEKMFIGRYDVPLEEGAEKAVRTMAKEMADELAAACACKAEACFMNIYVSPLKRAMQTAEIMKDVWERYGGALPSEGKRGIALCIEEDFQEISLGAWDGMPIRKVREEFPDAYARRGKDIFSFKIGNKAENFYDVQYRAVKALRKILESDHSDDIVIVAHNTVIRALENNLTGKRIDDPWEGMDKCNFRVIGK